MVRLNLPKWLKREKEEKKEDELPQIKKEEPKPSELDIFCGDDKELYGALQYTMFLDPKIIVDSMDGAVEKAKELEKNGDNLRARIQYLIAGGLQSIRKIYPK